MTSPTFAPQAFDMQTWGTTTSSGLTFDQDKGVYIFNPHTYMPRRSANMNYTQVPEFGPLYYPRDFQLRYGDVGNSMYGYNCPNFALATQMNPYHYNTSLSIYPSSPGALVPTTNMDGHQQGHSPVPQVHYPNYASSPYYPYPNPVYSQYSYADSQYATTEYASTNINSPPIVSANTSNMTPTNTARKTPRFRARAPTKRSKNPRKATEVDLLDNFDPGLGGIDYEDILRLQERPDKVASWKPKPAFEVRGLRLPSFEWAKVTPYVS